MKVVIAGGTGFVGRALSNLLLQKGHDVIVLTRNKNKQSDARITYIEWLNNESIEYEKLNDVDAIINLAGESINNRWTTTMKEHILTSRLKTTESIHQLIKKLSKKPNVYIQASAIGFYGTSDTETFTEKHEQAGNDFLAKVVSNWEQIGKRIENEGIRTVYMRFGVVLDRNEGALPRLVFPYKLFTGGTIGNGKQWISWIHINDVCKLILFAIEQKDLNGIVNVTAPNPVQMKTFGKTVSRVLKRPHWLPVPAFVLKTMLGEMSMLILKGQRVLPEKALQHGFTFQFNTVQETLEDLFS